MNGLTQNIQKIVEENTPKITDWRLQIEIGEDLNVLREAVARLFKKMEHLGIDKLGQNEIKYLG